MATAKFVCGAECGLATTGTASNGTEHWGNVTAGVTVVTSGPASMRSTRAYLCNATGATCGLTHTFGTAIASPATMVARFYVYFAALPSADTILFGPGVGANLGAAFRQSDSKIYAHSNAAFGTGFGATGITVTTDTWYRIDVQIVRNTTETVDVQVDGTACGQTSRSTTASNATGCFVGSLQAVNCNHYVDDLIVATDGWPLGAGTTVGLYPNGDRTNTEANPNAGNYGHFYNLVSDFNKNGTGKDDLGAQNVESTSWQSLTKPLSTTVDNTKFIIDQTGADTEHLVWTHDAMPAGAASVNGVMLVATTHSASTSGNTQSMKLSDASGNTINAWSLLDLSESTITVPCAIIATAPDGSAWTVAKVDAAYIRWGDAGDVNPDPQLDGVVLEVDLVETTGTDAPAGAGAAAAAANNATITKLDGAGAGATAAAAYQAKGGVGANAGAGAASAAAYDATVETAVASYPNAEVAETTTAAYDATVTSVAAPGAGVGQTTAAAYDVTASRVDGVGAAASTALAYDATVDRVDGVTAGATTAVAYDATVAKVDPVEAAQTAAVAYDATVTSVAEGSATLAAATALAYDATVSTLTAVDAPAELGETVAAAYDAALALTVLAEVAEASAAAYDVTAQTSATADAPAGLAETSAVAYDATVSTIITAPAGLGATTAVAYDATVSKVDGAQGAAVSATAYPVTASRVDGVTAGVVSAAAYDVTVSTSTSVDAPAQIAVASAAAYDATVQTGAIATQGLAVAAAYDVTSTTTTNPDAETALASATAYDARAAVGANAELAEVSAGAVQSVIWIGVNAGTGQVGGGAWEPGIDVIAPGVAHPGLAGAFAAAYNATVLIERPGGHVDLTVTRDRVLVAVTVTDHVDLTVTRDRARTHATHEDRVAVSSGADHVHVWSS